MHIVRHDVENIRVLLGGGYRGMTYLLTTMPIYSQQKLQDLKLNETIVNIEDKLNDLSKKLDNESKAEVGWMACMLLVHVSTHTHTHQHTHTVHDDHADTGHQ